ncbi:ATP-binding protein [Nannocystis pusilla]|uniref:histidine kinase n=1 Tax=Nannocystis pusilla TaxID=889268 RepID=A0A9X3EKS7_9BACT|nr:ATP-binding protein [Nannocystis pusilla]
MLVLGVAGLGLAVVLFVGGAPLLHAASAFAAGAVLLWCAHALRVRDSLIHDLTAERIVLQASRQQIDSVSRAKSDFIANISHEIRTPLAGVLGTTALLAETSLNDEQRAYLTAIRGAAEGLMALLGDILDMSKIEAGHLTFERSPFDLRKLAEDVIAMFGYVTRDKGVVLRLTYAEGAARVFFGDPLRIRQVLTNLVSNAVKFTAAGEVRIEIRVGPTLHDEATVELRVQDTGIGITAEQLPRIFDSFVQADASTTRRFGGTGLGLAICRALVRGMGGSLEVESQPGSGSTFTAAVPLTVASEHDLSESQVPAPPAGAGSRSCWPTTTGSTAPSSSPCSSAPVTPSSPSRTAWPPSPPSRTTAPTSSSWTVRCRSWTATRRPPACARPAAPSRSSPSPPTPAPTIASAAWPPA